MKKNIIFLILALAAIYFLWVKPKMKAAKETQAKDLAESSFSGTPVQRAEIERKLKGNQKFLRQLSEEATKLGISTNDRIQSEITKIINQP